MSLKFNFSIVFQKQANDINTNKNSSFQLPNYNVEHPIRKSGKGGVVCIFIHESLDYKVRKDLAINCDAIESLSIEISNRKLETRYLMLSTGVLMETQKSVNSFVKIYFPKTVKTLKNIILAGDFNINALD